MSEFLIKSWKEFLVISGGATIFAYSLFVWLGKKWLEQKFAKELEDFKFKAVTLFNRISKIHDKELNILPKAWGMLVDAHTKVTLAVHPLKTYPDLENMDEDEFNNFLDESNLNEYDKKTLRNSSTRFKSYKKIIFNYDTIQC